MNTSLKILAAKYCRLIDINIEVDTLNLCCCSKATQNRTAHMYEYLSNLLINATINGFEIKTQTLSNTYIYQN